MAVRWKPKKMKDSQQGYFLEDVIILGKAFYDSVRINTRDAIPYSTVAVAVEIRHETVTVFFVDKSGDKCKYELNGKRVSKKYSKRNTAH